MAQCSISAQADGKRPCVQSLAMQLVSDNLWLTLLCQAKGDTVGSYAEKLCANLGGFDEEFYNNGSSRAGILIRLGCIQGHYSFAVVQVLSWV